MMVEINFGNLYRSVEYEWKYIIITDCPICNLVDRKFRRVRDVEVRDIGDKFGLMEIHFTLVRKNKSNRMVVLGKLAEMMSIDQ